jgi:hypothetical protein
MTVRKTDPIAPKANGRDRDQRFGSRRPGSEFIPQVPLRARDQPVR